MNFTIDYTTRDRVRTVALSSALDLKSVSNAADSLRSWAMIRGVPVGGRPFIRLTGSMACRVHLPILTEVMPHPETGIELDAGPLGEAARVHDVRFGEVRGVGRELQNLLGATSPANSLEFHSIDGDFISGDVVLVLAEPPQSRPTTLVLQGAADSRPMASVAVGVRVITIARQHGTGGEAVADAVARRAGLRLFDYEVFRRAAEQAGVTPETIEGTARHRGLLSRMIDGLARGSGSYPELWTLPVSLRETPLFTSGEYRSFVEDAIRDVADRGDAVILGHGAQLVLAERTDTFRVLITGSMDQRVARAVATGLSANEARSLIREADQERVEYFREFYSRGWLDPASYDLVVNTDRIALEDAAGIILDAIARRSRRNEPAVAVEADAGREPTLGAAV